MSVVNKMLQDLETRKKRSGLSADYVPSRESEQGIFKPWMLGASVCVISLAILLSQVNWQNLDVNNVYAQQLPPALFSADVPAVEATNVNATSLSTMADSKAPVVTQISTASVAQRFTNETNLIKAMNVEQNKAPDSEIVIANTNPVSNEEDQDQLVKDTQTVVKSAPAPANMVKTSVEEIQNKPTGEFRVSPSNGAKAGISSLREQARIALNDDDIRGALNALETLIADYPEDIRARKQLASLLFSNHGVERAYQVLKDGLVLTPADNAMRVMLARVAFKTGNFQDAHNALAGHPFPELADIELISFRAALAERLSRYENAHQDYKLLVAREPRNAKWWLGLGVSQDKLKLVQPALESYRQAKNLKQLPTQVDTFVEERIAVLAGQS